MVGFIVGILIVSIVFVRNWEQIKNTVFFKKDTLYAELDLTIPKYLSTFRYYQVLSTEGKTKFRKRLSAFMLSKNFQGWGAFEVTEEMKVMISASAIQLTFGLKDFILEHYHIIRVAPAPFYSKMMDVYMKGGTSESGIISLSWKDFVEGYADGADKLNLGLHEMAHALKLDVLKGSHFDERFANYIDNWEEIGNVEFARMHKGSPSFLRSYGGTNMHEFFAVCVEHFFEAPLEFKARLPEIYFHLCFLLNQDPLNTAGDYRLSENFMREVNSNTTYRPIPKKLTKNLKYVSWHWSLTSILLGIFVAPFIIIILSTYTVILEGEVLYSIFVSGTLGLFQWLYFKGKGLFKFVHFLGYSYLGFGVCFTAILLLLNFVIRINNNIEETYKIAGYDADYSSDNNGRPRNYIIYLEDGAYNDHKGIRTIDYEDNRDKIYKSKKIKYTFAKGMFGYKVWRNYELE